MPSATNISKKMETFGQTEILWVLWALIRLIKALERILFHGGLNKTMGWDLENWLQGRPGAGALMNAGQVGWGHNATSFHADALMGNLDTICCLAFRLLSVCNHCTSWRSLLWRSHSWVYPSANLFSEQFHQKWRQISLRHFFMVCYVCNPGWGMLWLGEGQEGAAQRKGPRRKRSWQPTGVVPSRY